MSAVEMEPESTKEKIQTNNINHIWFKLKKKIRIQTFVLAKESD